MTLAETLNTMRRAPFVARSGTLIFKGKPDEVLHQIRKQIALEAQDIDRNAPGYRPGISREVMG